VNWSDISKNPPPEILRQFALACLAFSLLPAVRAGWTPLTLALAALGAVVCLLGLVWPAALRWPYVGAMIAAFPVGWLVSLLVMAVMFYLVFTPLALAFRLAGRDLLRRQRVDATTCWLSKPRVTDPCRYLRQF